MSGRKDPKRKNIIIACGGSAGHIFPGLALADELKKRYSGGLKILFITSDNVLARKLLKDSGYDFYALPVKGIKKRSVLGNIDFMSSLFAGALKSLNIVFRERPDCLVSFGSYISGPPFVAAFLLKIPTLIHEQNIVMGKGNRAMRRFATKIALSFPVTARSRKNNIVITGNPIRHAAAKGSARETALGLLGMDAGKFTLLVVGGSQGSRTLNTIAISAMKAMDILLRKRIQIIHITGEADYDRMKSEYEKIEGVTVKLYSFFDDMGTIYSAADIAVSRAGSSAIFELCARKIPAVLIPYPFAEGHQVKNAGFLAERNAAIVIEEKHFSEESLNAAVLKLFEDKSLRELMSKQLGALAAPDAAKKLADEVSSLAGL